MLAACEGFFTSPPRFTVGGWLAVVSIGTGSGLGYYLWLWALGHTTPTRVTVFPGSESRHRDQTRCLAPR